MVVGEKYPSRRRNEAQWQMVLNVTAVKGAVQSLSHMARFSQALPSSGVRRFASAIFGLSRDGAAVREATPPVVARSSDTWGSLGHARPSSQPVIDLVSTGEFASRAFGGADKGSGWEVLALLEAVLGLAGVLFVIGLLMARRHRAAQEAATAALGHSEQNLRALADNAYDGILVNAGGAVVFANRRMAEIMGYGPGELVGVDVEELLSGHEPAVPVCRYIESCTTCRFPIPFQDVLRRKNGTEVPVEVSAARGEWKGQPATIVIVRDISERERAESQLRETEERLRQITDSMREVFFMRELDEERLSYVSPAYERIWGRPLERLYREQHDFIRSVHPEDLERVKRGLAVQKEGGFSEQEYRIVRPDGTVRWVRSRTFPVYNKQGHMYRVTGVAEDITEYRQAEEALRASEFELRRIIDLVPHNIFAKDERGQYVLVNEATARFFGKSVDEMVGARQQDVVFEPNDAGRLLEDDRQVIETGCLKYVAEEIIHDGHGQPHVFETVKIPYPMRTTAEPAVLGVATDISARKRAEEALKASEEKYRILMEHASDAILLADAQGNLCDCNHRAEELLGYSRSEIVRLGIDDIYSEHGAAKARRAMERMSVEDVVLIELPMLRKDGSQFVAEINSTFIEYGETVLAHAVVRDVTARREAEIERLEQARGQRDALVREVHHRIKNNLQGVAGLLRQHVNQHAELRRPLETAIGQVHSMAIVHGLQGQRRPERVTLREMIGAICDSASGVMGRPVEFRLESGAHSPLFINSEEAVPLALVLNELVFNAIKHSPQDDDAVLVCVDGDGEGATVTIRNRGAKLPRGFDFSERQGLGTGLRLVHSLLPERGMSLSFMDSAEGVTATLSLSAPVIEGASPHIHE